MFTGLFACYKFIYHFPFTGLASIAKVLIAMQDGVLPPNLHYTAPNPEIPALTDGRLRVVTECTRWNGGYVAVNSFGFGGANVHVLLKSYPKERQSAHPASLVKRLLTHCSRTEEGLEHMFRKVHQISTNIDAQALLQESADTSPSTHSYRGYTILNTENEVQDIQVTSPCHRIL